MVIDGLNFGSIVVAGLVGGYAMMFVGYWMEGVFGLPRFDCSQDGVVYLGREAPHRWVVGVGFHLIDSILFALPFGAWGHVYLPGPGWLRGLVFGILLAIAVQVVGVGGSIAGGKHFRAIPRTAKAIVVGLFLTTIYGFVVGALYVPPRG